MIAPLIQAAVVEKNCEEYLTQGSKGRARLKISLHSKEESREANPDQLTASVEKNDSVSLKNL